MEREGKYGLVIMVTLFQWSQVLPLCALERALNLLGEQNCKIARICRYGGIYLVLFSVSAFSIAKVQTATTLKEII